MAMEERWPIEVSMREVDRETRAQARLIRDSSSVTGHGLARRNPEDREVTEIGEEIAAARALADLANKILDTAAGDIEAVTQQRAHLHL